MGTRAMSLVLSTLLSVGPIAHAEEPAEAPDDGHHADMALEFAGAIAPSGSIHPVVIGHVGVPLLHGHLEAVLTASLLDGAAPFEVLLELPVHLGDHIDTFVGAGPGLTATWHEAPRVVPTGTFAVGGHGWWGHTGWMVEADSTWAFTGGRPELRIGTGPAFRW
jgi:hypothetical protein